MKKRIFRLLSLVIIISLLFSIATPLNVFSAGAATISAESVSANPGETVNVKINLSNNPGIVSATIKVNFNSSILTLTNVSDAGILGSQSHKPEYTSPYTLAWANDTATSNYTVSGTVATLTFKVSDSAVKGMSYPIEVSYDYNNYEIYDKDLNPVRFNITNGSVRIPQEKTLSSISINSFPNKTTYNIGEALDTTGLQLKLIYSDGSTSYVSSSFTTSGFNSTSVGTKTVYVSYGGKTTTFNVKVESIYNSNGTTGDCTWFFDSNSGTLRISGSGNMDNYTYFSPSPWNDFNESIISVNIENGVNNIGDEAFYECRNLITADLPDTLTSIGNWAFGYCGKLTNIDIPDNVTDIGLHAFSRCKSFTNIHIPQNVKKLNRGTFYECTQLINVTLSDGLERIDDYTFYGCTCLSNIPLSNKMKYIGESAFSNCESIKSISIPDSVSEIGKGCFSGCINLSNIIISKSVTDINNTTFYNCKSLSTITLHNNVTRVGQSAFWGCDSLKTAYFSENLTRIEESAFAGCKNLNTITIPASVSYIGNYALGYDYEFQELSKESVTFNKINNFLIKGYRNTTAEDYANNNGFDFIVLDNTQPVDNAFIIADTVTAEKEDTVEVRISLINNPGIVSATIKVKYNSSVLTLTKVTDAGVLGAQSHKPEYTSPYTLAWANDTATTNYTVNGTIVTLSFKVGNNAVRGQSYPIELSYNYNNYEIYDKDLNPVQFGITNGSITVSQEKALTSIIVSKQPTKTTYFVGQTLDTTGLELTASYDDGSTAKVTSGFTTSGFDSSKTGTSSVTVTYGGKTATFTVTIKNKSLTSISISKQPTKTTYFVGESLDTTGLQLKLTYDDGSTSYVTSGYTTSGFSSTSTGTKAVTVTYQGKTTTFTVTIQQKHYYASIQSSVDSITLDLNGNNTAIVIFTVSGDFPTNASYGYSNNIYDTKVTKQSSNNNEYVYLIEGLQEGTTYFSFHFGSSSDEFFVERNIPITIVKSTKLLGDVDGDSVVTIIDATYIQRQLASISIPFEFSNEIADTDEDGSLSIIDATFIQRWLAALPSNDNIGKPIK